MDTSWLASTLGYISGNDILSNRVQVSRVTPRDGAPVLKGFGMGLKLFQLLEIGQDGSSDIADSTSQCWRYVLPASCLEADFVIVVQTELAKICLIKADILRMHLAFKELTLLSIDPIRKDIQGWYQDMPCEMRLDYAGRADLPLETRRSILYVHLLYLGAIMLLYRRLASQLIRSLYVEKDRDILKNPMGELLNTHCNEGVLAACSSARILKIMLEDECVYKRCWIVTSVLKFPLSLEVSLIRATKVPSIHIMCNHLAFCRPKATARI